MPFRLLRISGASMLYSIRRPNDEWARTRSRLWLFSVVERSHDLCGDNHVKEGREDDGKWSRDLEVERMNLRGYE